MTKVKVTSKLTKVIKKKLKDAVKDLNTSKTADQLADTYRDFIRNNAASLGTGKRYPALKRSTKQYRKYIARNNKTHPNYNNSSPNLTITGKFLDSIRARISVKGKGLLFKINVFGSHPAYKGNTGKKIGKRVSNKIIRQRMIDLNRDPLEVGDKVTKDVFNFIKREISKRLK